MAAFWKLLWSSAWSETWSSIFEHLKKTVLGVTIAVATIAVFWALNSEDALWEALVGASVGLAVSACFFLILFLYKLILVAPYEVYADQKDQLDGLLKHTHQEDGRPNWLLHDLFFFVDENVLNSDEEIDRWEHVGQQLRDVFALGQITVWGRPIRNSAGDSPNVAVGNLPTYVEIPPEQWEHLGFTYTFFDETRPFGAVDVYSNLLPLDLRRHRVPNYFDVKVNRAQAMRVLKRSDSPKLES